MPQQRLRTLAIVESGFLAVLKLDSVHRRSGARLSVGSIGITECVYEVAVFDVVRFLEWTPDRHRRFCRHPNTYTIQPIILLTLH